MIGQIRSIPADKNWGFIQPDDGSEDHFFHETCCANHDFMEIKLSFLELGENIRVEFDSVDGPKGKRAMNVRRINA